MPKTKTVKPKTKVVKTKARAVKVKAKVVPKKAKKNSKTRVAKVKVVEETPAPVPVVPPLETPATLPAPVQIKITPTAEQKAGIPKVITVDQIEGVMKISHLPFETQLNRIFSPLHAVTRTEVTDGVSESTFIVPETKNP